MHPKTGFIISHEQGGSNRGAKGAERSAACGHRNDRGGGAQDGQASLVRQGEPSVYFSDFCTTACDGGRELQGVGDTEGPLRVRVAALGAFRSKDLDEA